MKTEQNTKAPSFELSEQIKQARELLLTQNPGLSTTTPNPSPIRNHRLQKVLVANRGEIAKRFFLALHEEEIPSVAVVTEADLGQSWYDFADEVVFIGDNGNYTNPYCIIAAALLTGANAIYPGYGFLSENARFVEMIESIEAVFARELIFMGPPSKVMLRVGDKLAARKLATAHSVPLFKGSAAIDSPAKAAEEAAKIGYPVIIKLDSGGGGKGMLPVSAPAELPAAIESCQRIGRDLYQDDTYYLEKFIESPVHMEVQIFNGMAVGVRKCAVQRRNQKIIEESGREFLDSCTFLMMLSAAENMARICGYSDGAGAGTVEFLYDNGSESFGFLEINTRLQVEYAVTDQSLDIDLVKWQILYFDNRDSEIPYEYLLQQRFVKSDHAIECRIYAEDPETDFSPSPGKIQEQELPTFNGIRCDFGFREGDSILQNYDPMIGKLIAYGSSRKEALIRLERALQEIYLKGVTTNIHLLLKILRHPEFIGGKYTNRFLNDRPELAAPAVVRDPDQQINAGVAVILGSLTEYIQLIQQAGRELMLVGGLDDAEKKHELHATPNLYWAEYGDRKYKIEFFQTDPNTFYTFINGRFGGCLTLAAGFTAGGRDDDHLIRFANRSLRIRVDRRPTQTVLKLRDSDNKVQYYRMRIRAEGAQNSEPPGMLRSPFQGTFVKFAAETSNGGGPLKLGSLVQKGDPVMIVSAMKMETTIHAPLEGRIVQLVEDGDLSRLELGRTPDGKIIGKSIPEGEVLAVVTPLEDETAATDQTERTDEVAENIEEKLIKNLPSSDQRTGLVLNGLYSENPDSQHSADLEHLLTVLLELVRAYFQGFIQHAQFMEAIANSFQTLLEESNRIAISPAAEIKINDILIIYTGIKRLFSPVVVADFTYFDEFNLFLSNWNNESYRPPAAFQELMDALLAAYGITDRMKHPGNENLLIEQVFLCILRARRASLEQHALIELLLKLLATVANPTEQTLNNLAGLLLQEEAERDNSLAVFTRRVIYEKFPDQVRNGFLQSMLTGRTRTIRPDGVMAPEVFPGVDQASLLTDCKRSLSHPETALSPPAAPDAIKAELKTKLNHLEKSHRIQRLFSPLADIFPYRLQNKRGVVTHVAFAFAGKQDALPSAEVPFEHIKTAGVRAIHVLYLYYSLNPDAVNRMEIFASESPVDLDITNGEAQALNYRNLYRTCQAVLPSSARMSFERAIIYFDVRLAFSGRIERRALSVFEKNGMVQFDPLIDSDPRNPYFLSGDEKDARLFNRNKWPVDIWVRECFDHDSVQEIRIPSIDEVEWTNPKTKNKEKRPVGAKIYAGRMTDLPALFFLKDSRISGGATGNLEGLKYVAAAYIAYLKGWPLYVFNDGAGANIKEGMVSLNRAAQGFMMNTLLAERVTLADFRRYTRGSSDPVLRDLFVELDAQFNFDPDALGERKSSLLLTAVGVGSSAGLDVYGSSQAVVQVLLDSEESYRVLTGSNVIRAVTGEELTNYEIGGAGIMGKWAGIVDIVAHDKFHLVLCIRRLHRLFCLQEDHSAIQRLTPQSALPKDNLRGRPKREQAVSVLTESILRENVDRGDIWAFKGGYYGSGTLVSGFVKLGGRRALVMGPRSHFGLRSFAAVTRARELLRIANRTETPQILIYGRKWFREVFNDPQDLRVRSDFMNTLQKHTGFQIHIITHIEGLQSISVNSIADMIIFVEQKSTLPEQREFAEKYAAFIVPSMAGAFDLAQKLIRFLTPGPANGAVAQPHQTENKPNVPADLAQSFDVVQDVIEPVFDTGSFLECYRELNDPVRGPSLVTGLALLNGRTVGVIADQPIIMGGAPDAPGTEKFRFFMEFLNRHEIPPVVLSNAPGFTPGTRQERLRIQAIGAESLDVNILGRTPVVSVVLNQNYGGRQIHAFSKYLRPGIVYLALDQAILAVMGAKAAFDLFHGKPYGELLAAGKTDEANALHEKFFADFNAKSRASNDALKTGVLDRTIPEAGDLRGALLEGLELAERRVREAFEF